MKSVMRWLRYCRTRCGSVSDARMVVWALPDGPRALAPCGGCTGSSTKLFTSLFFSFAHDFCDPFLMSDDQPSLSPRLGGTPHRTAAPTPRARNGAERSNRIWGNLSFNRVLKSPEKMIFSELLGTFVSFVHLFWVFTVPGYSQFLANFIFCYIHVMSPGFREWPENRSLLCVVMSAHNGPISVTGRPPHSACVTWHAHAHPRAASHHPFGPAVRATQEQRRALRVAGTPAPPPQRTTNSKQSTVESFRRCPPLIPHSTPHSTPHSSSSSSDGRVRRVRPGQHARHRQGGVPEGNRRPQGVRLLQEVRTSHLADPTVAPATRPS